MVSVALEKEKINRENLETIVIAFKKQLNIENESWKSYIVNNCLNTALDWKIIVSFVFLRNSSWEMSAASPAQSQQNTNQSVSFLFSLKIFTIKKVSEQAFKIWS